MTKRILIASLFGVLMCYVGHGAFFRRESNDLSLRTALESVSALAKSHQHGPRSSEKYESETERGRQQEADEQAAERWKQKSLADDRMAFKLRQTANKDFDQSQELLHDSAVLRHKLSRTTVTETRVAKNLKADKAQILVDEQKLKEQKKLMKALAAAKKRAESEEKIAHVKASLLTTARSKLNIDLQHEHDQSKSVDGLLEKATKFAKMAVNGLQTSQQLRLKSEVDIGDDDMAAKEYEGSSTMQHRSKAWTRKALDLRSKAKLAQEYVAILKRMVAHDAVALKAAGRASLTADRAAARRRDRVEALRKKLQQMPVSKIEADKAAAVARRIRDQASLQAEEAKAARESGAAQRDDAAAMRQLHASHRLQAEAARDLSASTRAIEEEEARA